jgi:hypothetical protein
VQSSRQTAGKDRHAGDGAQERKDRKQQLEQARWIPVQSSRQTAGNDRPAGDGAQERKGNS